MILAQCKPFDTSNAFKDLKDSIIVDRQNQFRQQTQLSEMSFALQYVLAKVQDGLSILSH